MSSAQLKKKKFLKVASCVVLLIIPATKAQSLAHGCQAMAAGSLQSEKQEPPGKTTGFGWEGPPFPDLRESHEDGGGGHTNKYISKLRFKSSW